MNQYLENIERKNKEKMDCSGIYKLKYMCGSCYIVRTTRKFKDRLKEHRFNFKYNYPDRSKFAAHLLENCHPFESDLNCFEVVKIVNEKQHIDIHEPLEIFKASKEYNLVNEQYPNMNNPLFHTRLKLN